MPADVLRELVTYVAAQAGLTIGVDLYPGHVPPEKPDLAAAIIDRPGPDELQRAGFGRLSELMVQVLARGPTYFQAKTLAQRIHAVLHGAAGIDLGDHFLCFAEALAAPGYLGPDDQKPPRHLFSTNYQLREHSTTP